MPKIKMTSLTIDLTLSEMKYEKKKKKIPTKQHYMIPFHNLWYRTYTLYMFFFIVIYFISERI